MVSVYILLAIAALLLIYQLYIRHDEDDEELDGNGLPKNKKRLFK